MRYIGLLLIVVAGIGLGLYASHRLDRRVKNLQQLERLWESLWRQLSYSAQPMARIWQRLAEGEPFVACPLVRHTVAGLEQHSFSVSFGLAVERLAGMGWLQPAEAAVLAAFGTECGQYDLERETARIKECQAQLTELRLEAERTATARRQIYRVMGGAGGMALALLLL